MDKLDPRLGEKQLYPQTFQSVGGYSQIDLTNYRPQKVAQYTFVKNKIKKRNSTETLVSDVSHADSEIADRNEELLEIIGTDEILEDEHSEQDEEMIKLA